MPLMSQPGVVITTIPSVSVPANTLRTTPAVSVGVNRSHAIVVLDASGWPLNTNLTLGIEQSTDGSIFKALYSITSTDVSRGADKQCSLGVHFAQPNANSNFKIRATILVTKAITLVGEAWIW